MKNKRTAHIISHSHWDREWYMSFEKHRYYLVKLIDELLELFQKEPDFKSFHLDGQTILLEDYLEIRPEKREELKKAISEKKLHIGPWYVLQDAFLTSSESNIRNLLYGLRDAKEFGSVSKLGYFPDTFGIYGQAPQLLKQAKIETAAFGRGVKPTGFNNTVEDAKNFESPFSELKWESPDGSSILGILFANWYSNGNEVPEDEKDALSFWNTKIEQAMKYAATPHLLFMNGCDHQPVQHNLPAAILTAKKLFPDIDFVHASFDDYLKNLKASLPNELQTITGELRSQRTDGWSTLVNTASARIYLKQMNQECQALLEKAAEPLSVMAHLVGFEYPSHFLNYAWKTLMKNHPHDSICGCSVDEVHREMVSRFEKVLQITEMIVQEKGKEIASRIDTRIDNDSKTCIPIVIFNGSGSKREEVITKEVELEKIYFSEMDFQQIPAYFAGKSMPELEVSDSMGIAVPSVYHDKGIRFGYDLPSDGFRRPYFARIAELTFLAENVPQIGYKTYYVNQSENPAQFKQIDIMNHDREMENDFVHIKIHEDGSYTLTNKKSEKTYECLGIYENTGDIGNEYMFKNTLDSLPLTTKGLKAQIKVLENNSLRARVEMIHKWVIPKSADQAFEKEKRMLVWHKNRKASRSAETATIQIRTIMTLDQTSRGPSFQAFIENQAKDHRIRVLFPTNIQTDSHHADSVFEIVKRKNSPEIEWENPSFDHHQQGFVSMSDERKGLTIANKGLHEYEIIEENKTIALTLLRSVSELGDWGDFSAPEAQCLGENEAEWMVIPHSGDVIASESYHLAYQFQAPLTMIQTDLHHGDLPKDNHFLEWNGPSLAMSTFKMAEEGDHVVTRWFNTSDEKADLKVNMPLVKQGFASNIIEEKLEVLQSNNIEIDLKPFEIKTVAWTH